MIENQVQGQILSQSVVGIGVNINQTLFEWPFATSLKILSGKEIDKSKILETILIRLEAYYNLLMKKKFSKLRDEYYSVMYWKDEEHQFEVEKSLLTGTITGVDEVGRLLIKSGGKVSGYNFKEVKFIS